jgi:hypothetical protein
MPDISIIKKTIRSLKFVPEFYKNKVIICCDGFDIKETDYKIHPKCSSYTDQKDKIKYLEYIQNIKKYIANKPNIKLVQLDKRGCLTLNLKNGLKYVKTKYINIMQDDFSLTKSLPLSLSELFKIMEEEKMDIVRYMRFTNKTDLDRDDNTYCKLSKSPKTYTFNNHKFTKINLYSDNNHISTVDFYKNHVFPKCTNGSFMEFDVLCLAYEKDINFYAIGDLNDGNYIEHLDGRNTSNIKSLQNGGTIIDNNKKYMLNNI